MMNYTKSNCDGIMYMKLTVVSVRDVAELPTVGTHVLVEGVEHEVVGSEKWKSCFVPQSPLWGILLRKV
jgi:hypothetical protein